MKNCDFFLIFAQNIDRGYMLELYRLREAVEVVLTSTHDICFRAKIRKNDLYPCKLQFY